ncbi:MAG: glycosyltransferase family 8 protein [Verrucomicrobiaceae bacterium]|nr:MAG: glycosyltransferase family 8 protein [Verrucomicrobiaceae bacterium]
MHDPIQIAFGCDEAFAPHAGVVIQSILHNSPREDHFVFNVVTTALSDQARQRLLAISESSRSSLRVHALDISNLKNLPACHLTTNAYLRMFLPELLPDLERVIYLDCDLLAVASLRPLWEIRLRPGAIAAACEDIYSIFAKLGDTKLRDFLDSLGIKNGESYFNSGVMLMDLAGWRAHSITAKACEWGVANPDLIRHADQDILNVMLQGRVHYLPLRWNLSIHMIHRVNSRSCTTHEKEAAEDPAIIHFVGSNKANSLENPMPYQSEYLDRLAQTPWAEDFIPAQSIRQKFVRLRRRIKQSVQEKQLMILGLFGAPSRPIAGIVRVDHSSDSP